MSASDPGRTAESVLATRIGLDPQAVGDGAITRALHARMSALGLIDLDRYLRHLADSETEQQELVEEVVVPESWFFRDEQPFVALRECAAEYGECDSGMTKLPLRVLSIPCGCGEEPYSIAITLLDLGLTSGRFRIDAVDVSTRHLAVAERGVYRGNSFRGSDLAFRDRHFQPDAQAQSFTLDPSVRAIVRFTLGNLLDPHLLDGAPPYDIVFCRNVLIYLDGASRSRALATLDRLLRPGGLLFVGHAERPTIDDPRFGPYGENASFALRHKALGVPDPPTAAAAPPAPSRRAEPTQKLAAPEGPVCLPQSSATLLAEAASLADQGRSDEAAAGCEAVLARFGPSPAVLFLLGLVRQSTDRFHEAEICFRKAIYLDPNHDEALLALALCAKRRGDSDEAAGYRRRAERARARKGMP
jgi:chemotaxis protein methyltransferase WspC